MSKSHAIAHPFLAKAVKLLFFTALVTTLLAALVALNPSSVPDAAAASAGVGACYSGISAGTNDWAWGSCTGVTGRSRWRLHVSCTWGKTRYSSWFYGSGRTDVHCPWPERVRATQIDILY